MEHHRQRATGQVFDLAARPYPTIDIVPFFEQAGLVYVLARTSYPRPILLAGAPAGDIDGSRSAATSPNRSASSRRIARSARPSTAAAAGGGDRGGAHPPDVAGDDLLPVARRHDGRGAVDARGGRPDVHEPAAHRGIRLQHVGARPRHRGLPVAARGAGGRAARRAPRAQRLRPAAPPGATAGAVDRRRGARPGIAGGRDNRHRRHPARCAAGARRPPRLRARRHARDFLRIECRTFDELDAHGAVLASRALELVVPHKLSANTVSVALLARVDGQTLLGVDEDDLPAAQGFSGNSDLLVTPAWRLPADITTTLAARDWIARAAGGRIRGHHRRRRGSGRGYRPSPGLTPETVFPARGRRRCCVAGQAPAALGTPRRAGFAPRQVTRRPPARRRATRGARRGRRARSLAGGQQLAVEHGLRADVALQRVGGLGVTARPRNTTRPR